MKMIGQGGGTVDTGGVYCYQTWSPDNPQNPKWFDMADLPPDWIQRFFYSKMMYYYVNKNTGLS